jgi:hypothetical protein
MAGMVWSRNYFRVVFILSPGIALGLAVGLSLSLVLPSIVRSQEGPRFGLEVVDEFRWVDMRVTLVAEGVSRALLLEELRRKHQIEVRLEDVPDEVISVNLVGVPLTEAISALVPRGSHYAIRFGERELEIPSTNFEQAKRGEPEVRGADLPTKNKTRPLPDSERVDVKLPAAEWREPGRRREGPDIKPEARRGSEVEFGKGAKEPLKVAEAEMTPLFNFVIEAPDRITLTSATMVPGAFVANPVITGPFLYLLRGLSGEILTFGTLPDPLEMHSYQTDGTHTPGRADAGSFGIWLPEEFADSGRLSETTLEFYDIANISMPTAPDARGLGAALEGVESLIRVPGEELGKAVEGSLPQ